MNFDLVRLIVTGRDRSHGLPALSRVWQHVKLSDVSLGTRPRYSLVADTDVKEPTKQTNKLWLIEKISCVSHVVATPRLIERLSKSPSRSSENITIQQLQNRK